jgi:hypothetical protein
MSGRSSRDKGKRGELEACEYLAMTLGGRWTRTGSAQRRQDAKLADVTCDDWPDLHVEVKRGKRNLNLWAALEQAKRDSAGTGRTPVVLARRDREQWVLFAEADDLARLWARPSKPICNNCKERVNALYKRGGMSGPSYWPEPYV